MSEFAIACCDATVIVTIAINITIAIPATGVEFELILFGFRINDLRAQSIWCVYARLALARLR
ncbi:MAG: hypothetical protein WB390_20905 [Pseudolabrys sp.]